MYKGIIPTVKALDATDEKAIGATAESLTEKAYRNVRRLVNMLHEADDNDFPKAAGVLLDIGNLALVPLVETMETARPATLMWDLETIVSIQLANQHRVVTLLDRLLDDRDRLEPADLFQVDEEPPPPRRICDQAYLMMRLLLALEDSEQRAAAEATFLDLTEEDRDIEIARVRESGDWSSLLKDPLAEDEY